MLALSVATALPGCYPRASYRPSKNEPRMSIDDLRSKADTFLQVECPRLMGTGQSALGAMEVLMQVGRDGSVQRVRTVSSTNDKRLDKIFGTYAAQLKFDPPRGLAENQKTMDARMMIGYSCSPTAAAATVELKP